jgi:hypothetical protein
VTPTARAEDVVVTVTATATGLTATLARTGANPYPTAGAGFTLNITLFCMGA